MGKRYSGKKHTQKEAPKEQEFLHTTAWRRLRVIALRRDHYLCQACLRKGRITIATEVHHVLPRSTHPELALVLDNLESLCWTCHEDTKPRERKSESKIPDGVRVIRVADGSENE